MKKHTRVITIFNQKGGVAKTTTTVNIAAIMGDVLKKKVLIIDFDAQGSATLMCNLPNWDEEILDIGDLLEGFALDGIVADNDDILSAIHKGGYEKNVQTFNQKERKLEWNLQKIDFPFDIIPVCGTALSIAELAIHRRESFIYQKVEYSFYMLKIIVDKIVNFNYYDYIIIDANPSLSNFAINSLAAADYLIVPTTMTLESISGINNILNRLKELNLMFPHFHTLGILYQRFSGRRTLDRNILDEMDFDEFETKIPDVNTKVSKSISEGKIPSLRNTERDYANFRQSYIDLCNEIEEKIERFESEKGEIQRKGVPGYAD